jgi:hypothetical protein
VGPVQLATRAVTAAKPCRQAVAPARLLAFGLICTLLFASINQTNAAPPDTPDQLAGLFMQSCLAFAGDAVGLRGWARQIALIEVPDPARTAFLHGAPGVVFDASTPGSKLVVVSSDDGICSVITDKAPGPAVVAALENDLTRSGIAFRLAIERDDKQIPVLHDREYLATKNGRSWRILAATVTEQQPGQGMLTAAPE